MIFQLKNKMRVLFIEDKTEAIQGIIDYVEEKEGWEYKNSTFKEAPGDLTMFAPDLVVMDWMYDAENLDEGAPIFRAIYEHDFIPTIVFSAIAPTISGEVTKIAEDNPMIEILSKGDEQVVIKKIEQWEPYILAVKQSRKELNSSLLNSARAMAYYFNIADIDVEVVKYMLRKRIENFFPQIEDCESSTTPPAWVEYEYPPICKTLMVADILRKNDGDNSLVAKAKKYYVVFTPSCDMERGKATDDILLAQCESAGSLYKNSGEEIDLESAKLEVKRYINTGYNYAKVPLPELPQKIPYMTVNLKKLELVKLGDVALDEKSIDGKNYYRIASLSSPFRENLVWAHMINSCRPGMPNRDVDTWVVGITEKE